jgi:Putative prokaryotic signal transducing protein
MLGYILNLKRYAEGMTSSSIPQEGDPTHHLDAEIIYEGQGQNAAVEAMNIKGVLEANGITVLSTDPVSYPSLPVLLRVPKDQVAKAKQVLSEAEAAGPAAAEAEELATENRPSSQPPAKS